MYSFNKDVCFVKVMLDAGLDFSWMNRIDSGHLAFSQGVLSASLTLYYFQFLITIVSNIAMNVLAQTTLWLYPWLNSKKWEWLGLKDPYCQITPLESLVPISPPITGVEQGEIGSWLQNSFGICLFNPPTAVGSWMVESRILQIPPNPSWFHHGHHS